MAQPHKSHKPKLDDVHRAFIVRELACFASPKEAAPAAKSAAKSTTSIRTWGENSRDTAWGCDNRLSGKDSVGRVNSSVSVSL